MSKKADTTLRDLFAGGGEMGRLMRVFDWAKTDLGPPETWPLSLRVAIRIVLGSGYPIYIAWGPKFFQFYNDGYFPILGDKHPAALGKGTPQTFPEIWDFIGPMFRKVMEKAEATTLFDQILFLERNGYPEETHFTFSYSPIPSDEASQPGGVFVTALETTERVIEERRLTLLRDLANATSEAHDENEVLRLAASVLETDLRDMPFSLLYSYDPESQRATLVSSAGLKAGEQVAPESLECTPGAPWPLHQAVKSDQVTAVSEFRLLAKSVPNGAWEVPPVEAMVLPLKVPAQETPSGFLIAGVNPHKRLDAKYEQFAQRVALQIARNVADARAYQAERARAEQLAALDHAKTAFFSNVSHEFRTPLTLMLGPLEQALAKPTDWVPAEYRALVSVAHRNGLRLLKLVNMLLDFSRIEAGRVKAVYRPTDLSRFTRELASLFQSTVERGGLELQINCDPLAEPVFVDHEMWEKIVLNLMSNAFKFTVAGKIEVTLRTLAAAVELSVKDTGVGIPPEEMPRLFERFHRVEQSRGRSFEGSGIGLALVQELVKLHSGKIRVESSVGQGSNFVVSLPRGRAHLPPDSIEDAADSTVTRKSSYVEEIAGWLPSAESAAALAASVVPAQPGKLPADAEKAETIVLADDNADMRSYVKGLLENRYSVIAVANGKEALEAISRTSPDLIITDVMMPVLDGFGLISAVKSNPATRLIPCLMLSARAGEEFEAEGLLGGADDYLVKPFTALELLARVHSHLNMAKLRKEAALRERELRAEATSERNRLSDLFLNAPFAVAMLGGPDHRFILVNSQMADLLGRAVTELTGKRHAEVWSELRGDPYNQLLDEVYRTGKPYFGKEMPAILNRANKSAPGYFNFVYQPTVDAKGRIDGVLVAAFEVTEQVFSRMAVEKSEASLRFAQHAANIGSWELDIEAEQFSWSDLASRMIGHDDAGGTSTQEFLNRLPYPADREAFRQALDRTLRKRVPFETEFRIAIDGAVSLLSARGTMFYNQGSPLLIGFFINVGKDSARKRRAAAGDKAGDPADSKTRQKSVPARRGRGDNGRARPH